ncbi:hypothetical protein [Streptomyces sp. NBC_00091]|uniref:MerR family transcriptional regulator n=1 Tax=Streptomyces sp. NBC_00091 TaxID=2975648 RepID=UPI00225BD6C8|nr:hypothetical protein [Streptomyces sp. NBC_00091]MCX5378616.1 hypothetical protein [Streptomyces sp. NBC_00091]
MRIEETAGIVRVTTRTIREYGRVGLLRERERHPNGHRDHLTLLDAPGAGGEEIYALLGPLASDPAVLALYERLDELAGAPADDPRIGPLAAEMVAAVPDAVFAAIPADGPVVAGFEEALLAEFAPAQAEVVRRVMRAFTERGRR